MREHQRGAEVIQIERSTDGATVLHTVKMIGDTLETEYPGWLWFVEVKSGIATIKSMHANPRYGYVLKLMSGFYSASELKRQVLHAGGELLERLGMPRVRADWDRIQAHERGPHLVLHFDKTGARADSKPVPIKRSRVLHAPVHFDDGAIFQ